MTKYASNLKFSPTDSNKAAAAQFGPAYAKQMMDQIRAAGKRLHELSGQPTATPEEILGAVLAWRAALPAITGIEHDLIGSAVLGGAAVTTTASKLTVRPQTLAAWLAKTVAQYRGRELYFDTDKNEWKAY
ncbi:Uncharacterised protein [Mycobacteroides abscessus subsp. abscessus]|uniref:hypothetical protein n=1 Tax=Mycobacteroides abscessus TaxID=36809 RepID=UPI0009276759|nr:hypothetical protein [Mycobacteroides abscessus]SHX66156.1 Uncharacterised protein [Mycobacteroides abscessus subsp. abscessus]SIC60516.1 Uncharacterised protein [Mycobacteroides abscessus subsp. abscessus]SKK21228.1 Uncharacterised protein [Mycobacteroides abscessus subsp. abscessus]SKP50596.1 Uncharacterised protein [Mycobacteroides abscessus subsp. abscessus]